MNKLNANTSHPHACPTCRGQGVEVEFTTNFEEGGVEWQRCPSCLLRGLNPLDTTTEITDEEHDLWVENALTAAIENALEEENPDR